MNPESKYLGIKGDSPHALAVINNYKSLFSKVESMMNTRLTNVDFLNILVNCYKNKELKNENK